MPKKSSVHVDIDINQYADQYVLDENDSNERAQFRAEWQQRYKNNLRYEINQDQIKELIERELNKLMKGVSDDVMNFTEVTGTKGGAKVKKEEAKVTKILSEYLKDSSGLFDPKIDFTELGKVQNQVKITENYLTPQTSNVINEVFDKLYAKFIEESKNNIKPKKQGGRSTGGVVLSRSEGTSKEISDELLNLSGDKTDKEIIDKLLKILSPWNASHSKDPLINFLQVPDAFKGLMKKFDNYQNKRGRSKEEITSKRDETISAIKQQPQFAKWRQDTKTKINSIIKDDVVNIGRALEIATENEIYSKIPQLSTEQKYEIVKKLAYLCEIDKRQLEAKELNHALRNPSLEKFESRFFNEDFVKNNLLIGRDNKPTFLTKDQFKILTEFENILLKLADENENSRRKPFVMLDTGEGKTFCFDIFEKYREMFDGIKGNQRDLSEIAANEEAQNKIRSVAEKFKGITPINLANKELLEGLTSKNLKGQIIAIDENLFIEKIDQLTSELIDQGAKIIRVGASQNPLIMMASSVRQEVKAYIYNEDGSKSSGKTSDSDEEGKTSEEGNSEDSDSIEQEKQRLKNETEKKSKDSKDQYEQLIKRREKARVFFNRQETSHNKVENGLDDLKNSWDKIPWKERALKDQTKRITQYIIVDKQFDRSGAEDFTEKLKNFAENANADFAIINFVKNGNHACLLFNKDQNLLEEYELQGNGRKVFKEKAKELSNFGAKKFALIYAGSPNFVVGGDFEDLAILPEDSAQEIIVAQDQKQTWDDLKQEIGRNRQTKKDVFNKTSLEIFSEHENKEAFGLAVETEAINRDLQQLLSFAKNKAEHALLKNSSSLEVESFDYSSTHYEQLRTGKNFIDPRSKKLLEVKDLENGKKLDVDFLSFNRALVNSQFLQSVVVEDDGLKMISAKKLRDDISARYQSYVKDCEKLGTNEQSRNEKIKTEIEAWWRLNEKQKTLFIDYEQSEPRQGDITPELLFKIATFPTYTKEELMALARESKIEYEAQQNNEIESLNKELQELAKLLHEKTLAVNEKEKIISEMTPLLEEAQKSIEDLIKEKNALESNLQNLQTRFHDLKKERSNQVIVDAADLEEANNQYKLLTNQLLHFAQQIEDKKSELANLAIQESELNKSKEDDAKEAIDSLLAEKQRLEEILLAKEQSIIDIENQQSQLKEKADKALEDFKLQQDSLTQIAEEFGKLKSANELLNQSLSTKEELFNNEKNELTKKVSKLENWIGILQTQNLPTAQNIKSQQDLSIKWSEAQDSLKFKIGEDKKIFKAGDEGADIIDDIKLIKTNYVPTPVAESKLRQGRKNEDFRLLGGDKLSDEKRAEILAEVVSRSIDAVLKEKRFQGLHLDKKFFIDAIRASKEFGSLTKYADSEYPGEENKKIRNALKYEAHQYQVFAGKLGVLSGRTENLKEELVNLRAHFTPDFVLDEVQEGGRFANLQFVQTTSPNTSPREQEVARILEGSRGVERR